MPEHLLVPRIDRDDAVAVVEEVLRGEVAGPVPAGGQTDHRYDTILSEDSAQVGDVVTQRWGSESVR